MSRNLRFAPASAAALILAAFALEGCGSTQCSDSAFDSAPSASGADKGNSSGASSGSAGNAGSAAAAQRAITEADIIQVQGGRLFAMSKSGTVSIVDVSRPGALTLLGQTTISGQPFEMYLRDNVIVAMSDGAFMQNGTPVPPASPGADPASPDAGAPQGTGGTSTTPDPSLGAAIVTIDVTNPATMSTIALFPVPGQLADSRIVGNALYLATYENSACFQCGSAPRTMVTSFDVSNPVGIAKVDQASFQSNAPDGYNLPWGSAWKRSIIATDTRLYIGGHADIDPKTFGAATNREGIIDVLDITDPTGKLGKGARIQTAGAVLSRWQMDERDGVLRVISQLGAGRTGNGEGMPEVATFTIQDTQTFVPLGSTSLKLPMQEGLRTVRFDANRAYAITYNQTDPLFTIDLSNPAAPAQRGSLSMPGFMFYLEPHGDRVIGLGVDRMDPAGSLNVSLFDVSDMDKPTMLKRVAFGAAQLSEDYAILNYEVPEDQDRIQKAFRVFPDGRVAVPFTSASYVYDVGSGCSSAASGVQLVTWQNDTLVKDALLPVMGNPRRAMEIGTDILAISDSNVTEFSLAKGSGYGKMEANVVIGTCVAKNVPTPGGGGGGQGGGGFGDGYGGGGYGGDPNGYAYEGSGGGCGESAPFKNWKACSVGPIGAGETKTGTLFVGLGLAIAGVVARRRRTSKRQT